MLRGQLTDDQTRCVHYHSPLDIIAIRFKCCGDYYPCYQCHEAEAGHAAITWSRQEWNEKAILCGVCRTELTIAQYMNAGHTCPSCGSAFNPRCSLHYHLYFEV